MSNGNENRYGTRVPGYTREMSSNMCMYLAVVNYSSKIRLKERQNVALDSECDLVVPSDCPK